MQEEQARRNAETAAVPDVSEVDRALNRPPHAVSPTADASMDEDEEAQLAAALALSQRGDVAIADEEEDEIQQAIRLSSADGNNDNDKGK